MSNNDEKVNLSNENDNTNDNQYSLNDDRRVKVLSPNAMVVKRFFRNKVAVVGLVILVLMFLFSFVGGWVSPYKETDLFYKYEYQTKEIAGAKENTDYKQFSKTSDFSVVVFANAVSAANSNKTSFVSNKINYTLTKVADEVYTVSKKLDVIGFIAKEQIYLDDGSTPSYELAYNLIVGMKNPENSSFTFEGKDYEVSEEGIINVDANEIGYISNYVVNSKFDGVIFSRDFKAELQAFISENDEAGNFKRDGENEKISFVYLNEETGETEEYVLAYSAPDSRWVIKQEKETYVYDKYAAPSAKHILGTDGNGMDMLTRLMYGGRVSLVIGFIVVVIEVFIGVIMGGISGFFGKWVDFLIMRIVDIMYCIPSTPILIILGAAMDALKVEPTTRMIYLMLILGFLGWPGIAHMVRGQILSLREQEFMTAAEATGLRSSKRIFKHLVPNVMPQLIVSSTMSLGSVILTEATLSFLGLGVRFPFASWGNIINDVNDTYVLTNYWWVWIPAGCCILLTVLAFNLVGDGLRDAFDPKMKR